MNRKVIIIVSIVAAVIIAGVAAYAFIPQVRNFVADRFGWSKTDDSSKAGQATSEEHIDSVVKDAQALAKSGNVEASYALIDKEIKDTDDKNTKTALYTTKANIANADKNADPSVGIGYAIQASDAAGTSESAAYVGALYERNNDTANAIRFYELAVTRAGTEDAAVGSGKGESNGYISSYKAKIQALRGE